MNTSFNILWFEDSDEWFNPVKDSIEQYIKSLNFKPIITRLYSIDTEQIKAAAKRNWDLIFVDLNLADNDKEGTKCIKLLREEHVLADILFYSTAGLEDLQAEMRTHTMEGVYYSIRRDPLFYDKAQAIVDKIVKRSEDVLNIRGMLMDNVSEFDDKIKKLIQKYLNSDIEKNKIDSLNAYAYTLVKNHLADTMSKAETLSTSDIFLLSELENTFFLDSNKLSRIIHKIFKDEYPHVECMQKFHENYSETILSTRNNLAHAKKEPDQNGAFSFKDKNGNLIVYGSARCSEIRENINTYETLFAKISNYLD